MASSVRTTIGPATCRIVATCPRGTEAARPDGGPATPPGAHTPIRFLRSRPVGNGDEHRGKLLGRIAQLLRVANPDAVALPAFDRLSYGHPTHCSRDHGLHVPYVESVPRCARAVDLDVQVVAGNRALSEGAARSRHGTNRLLHFLPSRSSSARSGPKILMPTGVRIP
jgi:hypothetical protein